MKCECGHKLDYVVGDTSKIRTKMLLLKKSREDETVLACVCPSCKGDVVIGLFLEKNQSSVDSHRLAP